MPYCPSCFFCRTFTCGRVPDLASRLALDHVLAHTPAHARRIRHVRNNVRVRHSGGADGSGTDGSGADGSGTDGSGADGNGVVDDGTDIVNRTSFSPDLEFADNRWKNAYLLA